MYVCVSLCLELQEFLRLADDMMGGRPTESGPTPPNMIKNQWSFLPPVVIDTAPFGKFPPLPVVSFLQSWASQHLAYFRDAVSSGQRLPVLWIKYCL